MATTETPRRPPPDPGRFRRAIPGNPYCLESSLNALGAEVPATDRHFVRSHFGTPPVDARGFVLTVEGRVRLPLRLRMAELRRLPRRTLTVTLECAGNSRTAIYPPTAGVRWGDGAVGTARWTGVPLAKVLARAGVEPDAVEIVLEGADRGTEPGAAGVVAYAMSLGREKALDPDTLLVFAMNGRPLRPEHGYPLRAIVPGYYGMASVKWLVRLVAVAEPFDGFFRSHGYSFVPEGHPPGVPGRPVTRLRVKSLITEPRAGAEVPTGRLRVRGVAWSGHGPIRSVEVRLSGPRGSSATRWQRARVRRAVGPHAWSRWEAEVDLPEPGHAIVRTRATDAVGNGQPEQPAWNLRGVEVNSIHAVAIEVMRPASTAVPRRVRRS